MLVAVTGSTGFLGRAVVAAAVAAGHRVRALVQPGRAPAQAPGVETISGALGDRAALARLVTGARCVIHLAAAGVQARERDWLHMLEVNVHQPLGLVEEASRAGIRTLVAMGTVLEYGGHGRLPGEPVAGDPAVDELAAPDPRDPYGAAKCAGGVVLRARAEALGLGCWYLRACSVYGPGDDPEKLLPAAVRQARARSPFDMTAGEQVREWLWIDDAVRAVLAAAERDPPGGTALVNVGTGRGHALAEVVREAYRLAGADPGLVRAGARPYRPGEVHRLVMDVSRAERLLGFSARTGLEAGLGALVASTCGEHAP